MNRRAVLAFLIATALMGTHADVRSTSVDFVLLIDTSLSMDHAIVEARRYAAGEIIGRLVEPGDWVSIIKFYGKTERVWQGDVTSQADIASIVRSLQALKADGRFTDIGSALDAMERLVRERAHPERPKYILLITDERQEAPAGTAYYSADHTIHHPMLEYIKRVDMGSFRVITIGYGLSAKIAGNAETLMTILSEPPARRQGALAGSSAGSESAGSSGAGMTAPADGVAGSASTGQDAISSMAGSGLMLVIAAIAGVLVIVLMLIMFGRRKRKETGDSPQEPQA
ncbi:MAG TPA: vWA domain-containing protein [bacterium]|nr:vWA domain-containing protein [bacterium]